MSAPMREEGTQVRRRYPGEIGTADRPAPMPRQEGEQALGGRLIGTHRMRRAPPIAREVLGIISCGRHAPPSSPERSGYEAFRACRSEEPPSDLPSQIGNTN